MKILITGASGGIGSAIYKKLSKEDHVFFLQYSNSNKKALLSDLSKNVKNKPYLIQTDLSNEAGTKKLIDFILNKGGADAIIHSVSAPTKTSNVFDKSWEDFQLHVDLQVKSLFQLVIHLSPLMKKNRFGRIIALASEYTVGRPPAKLSDYVTAKYALIGIMKSFAVELGSSNISCNCVSAGLTPTPLTSHLPNKLKEIIANQTPLNRLTSPDEIASLVEFLIKQESSMITGENLLINGGHIMG